MCNHPTMYMLEAVILKIGSTSEFPRGLVRTQMARHYPAVSDLVGFGRGLKILISKKHSGGADAAGPGTILRGPFS